MTIGIVGAAVTLPSRTTSLAQLEDALFAGVHPRREVRFQDDELAVNTLDYGIAPRQARYIDPQHLLVLDVASRALKDAGLGRESVRGSATAVYVAMTESDHLQSLDVGDIGDTHLPWVGTGNNRGVAAGRVSHFFDLYGPSLQVDTTCSSALVAVHMAWSALCHGEIDRAVVVATHLVRLDRTESLRAATGALSGSGACNAFTDAADGFVIGEGVVGVVLERTVAEDRRTKARVLSCAVNHGGRTSGLTVPSSRAQEAVIRTAVDRAGIAPADIAYVEAHGTGTLLGDPIEARALAAAYRSDERAGRPLYIGSNKATFGHLEAASGLLSILVASLVLARRQIPPTRSTGNTNGRIDWAGDNIELVREVRDLAAGDGHLVGVSSFGMSGTNAHAILAAPAAPDEDGDSR